MTRLFWLSDEAWAAIDPHLPRGKPGKPRVDDRRVISGILHVLKTGCRWRDVPPEYGPATTIYNRYNRWSQRGLWQRLFEQIAASGDVPHELSLDSSHVKAHRSAAGAKGEWALVLRSGSCRDLAVLMMAALCSRGLAARFVSGYRRLSEDEQEDQVLNGGNTHAWLQAYIPGPGWVDFDPSAGTMGNENLVRVAAVAHPHEAIQGTRYGHASDHLAMTVAVKVNLVD